MKSIVAPGCCSTLLKLKKRVVTTKTATIEQSDLLNARSLGEAGHFQISCWPVPSYAQRFEAQGKRDRVVLVGTCRCATLEAERSGSKREVLLDAVTADRILLNARSRRSGSDPAAEGITLVHMPCSTLKSLVEAGRSFQISCWRAPSNAKRSKLRKRVEEPLLMAFDRQREVCSTLGSRLPHAPTTRRSRCAQRLKPKKRVEERHLPSWTRLFATAQRLKPWKRIVWPRHGPPTCTAQREASLI